MASTEDSQVGDAVDAPPPDEQLDSLVSLENNNNIPGPPAKSKKSMVSSSTCTLSAGRDAGRQLQADPRANEPFVRRPFDGWATTTTMGKRLNNLVQFDCRYDAGRATPTGPLV